MARKRDYRAEYRRRKQLAAEREAAAARARRAESQRRYRARLKRAKDAGFDSVKDWEGAKQEITVARRQREDPLQDLLEGRRRGEALGRDLAGEIARMLTEQKRSPRRFFRAWYG